MSPQFDLDRLSQSDVELSNLIEEQGVTMVHFSFTASVIAQMGSWVCIWPTTYLVKKNSDDLVYNKLILAINIPVAPDRKFFGRRGKDYSCTLIFPKLPDDWTAFHFHEKTTIEREIEIRNIQRNNTGVYRVEL